MTRLYAVPLLLTLACATMHPRPVPDTGSGGSVPHANYLLQSIESQAMAPVGSPSWQGQAYSLTLNAPSGTNAIALTTGARIFMGSGNHFISDSASGILINNTRLMPNSDLGVQLGQASARWQDVFSGTFRSSSTTGSGTVTLAAGAGTATTFSGAVCICTDTTAAAAVKCSVASTTLSITGTGTDVIAYHCH